MIIFGKKAQAQAPIELIPGTITAVTPSVLCLIDGSGTPIKVKVPKYYSPTIGDRVGLVKIGSNLLALSTG